jgi:hypothetical protein
VDGTVQQLSAHTVGGVVHPAETLMVIVPSGSEVEIRTGRRRIIQYLLSPIARTLDEAGRER